MSRGDEGIEMVVGAKEVLNSLVDQVFSIGLKQLSMLKTEE